MPYKHKIIIAVTVTRMCSRNKKYVSGGNCSSISTSSDIKALQASKSASNAGIGGVNGQSSHTYDTV
jgi:hypothetical protein